MVVIYHTDLIVFQEALPWVQPAGEDGLSAVLVINRDSIFKWGMVFVLLY